MSRLSPLPVDAILPELKAALARGNSAVLVAPPGAGKTTRVPLALLDEPWLGGRKVLVLEPRRIAARAAATHMAGLRGERLGETVGLRARLATMVGPNTRIEVVTEGVFTRLILEDPSLDGIGAILFDEFHERSLAADLGLALGLDARAALRPDLRILVMSATLDATAVAGLLGDAPVIKSEGHAFPVVTRHLGRNARRRIEDEVADAIAHALRAEQGSVLAFLPGQGEVRRTGALLAERVGDPAVDIVELHGGLDQRAQQHAIAPSPPERRKVVLATSIAETSITIEGVRIVIDSGLQRVPRYEPDVGITRLDTVRVSRASADQRRGRAGRTEPGVCFRLWPEPETAGLLAYNVPEIRSADLSELVLDCAGWGESDPLRLNWLDPPAKGALEAARAELVALGALDANGGLTQLGQRMRALPLPPRLARMMLVAGEQGAAEQAAEIAAVLMERNLGGKDTDLSTRVAAYRRDRSERAIAMRRLAAQWVRDSRPTTGRDAGMRTSMAELLALAYPERIAKGGRDGRFVLANGRAGWLDAGDPLAVSDYLVVAELAGAAAAPRILLAAGMDEAEVLRIAKDQIIENESLSFEHATAALRARRTRRLGTIVLASEPRPIGADLESAALLAKGIASIGIDRLPWSKAQVQLRQRVAFLRASDGAESSWPDLSNAALAESAAVWLAPFIIGRMRLADITSDDLGAALEALVPWSLKRRLDEKAPTHFDAPTGNRVAIIYEGDGAPILAIRVQELFGLKNHPSVADGRLPLTLHLLSPAGRPLQITRDLPGFWRGSWADVKAEMKGRYPKHVWPDDPAAAVPTARAKPRSR
jgi:ATP-dependent helicase HrpB